jgi:tetratricopeptide (TPR) repeat protein
VTDAPEPVIEKEPGQTGPDHEQREEEPVSPGLTVDAAVSEVDKQPVDFYDWVMRSYARMREGQPEEAWDAAQKALELGTAEPDLFVPLCQQFPPERRRLLAHAAMERTPPTHDAFQWLWVEVALSYWYQGEYDEAVEEYQTILKQKNLDPGLVGILESSLGMSLEASGRYEEAEQRYLGAGNQEAAVRARARSGDVAGALALLQQGVGPAEAGIRQALEATFLGLLGQPIPDLAERLQALDAYQEDWIYKEFMAGVLLVIARRSEEGVAQLEQFLEVCRANPNEWGITLRWEIGIAEEILKILAGSGEAAPDQPEAAQAAG